MPHQKVPGVPHGTLGEQQRTFSTLWYNLTSGCVYLPIIYWSDFGEFSGIILTTGSIDGLVPPSQLNMRSDFKNYSSVTNDTDFECLLN